LAEAEATYGDALAQQYWAPGRHFDNEGALVDHHPLSNETDLSASGGSATTHYYASGLIKHDGGIITNTSADKQSLHLSLDQTISSRVTLRVNSEVLHTESDRGLTQNENNGSSFYAALASTPSFFDLRPTASGQFPVNPFGTANPLQTAALFVNGESVWRTVSGGSLDVLAVKGGANEVRMTVNGGVDLFTQENTVFAPPELQFEQLTGLPGTSILSYGQNLSYNLNAAIVHTFRPASGVLSATSQVGTQYEYTDLNVGRTAARNLVGGLQNVTAGTVFQVDQNHQRTEDFGLFAQEELLTLNERLLLTGGVRADQSSNN
jgi:hypothetical protein